MNERMTALFAEFLDDVRDIRDGHRDDTMTPSEEAIGHLRAFLELPVLDDYAVPVVNVDSGVGQIEVEWWERGLSNIQVNVRENGTYLLLYDLMNVSKSERLSLAMLPPRLIVAMGNRFHV